MVRHEAPIRSQYRRRKLLSQPYRNLRASKTTFISEKIFASHFRRCSSVCRRSFLVFSLHPLTATLRAEKRQRRENVFSDHPSISLLLNSHMRGPENDMFFQSSHFFQTSCAIEHEKSACLFSEADAHLALFSFTSSAGSVARLRPP